MKADLKNVSNKYSRKMEDPDLFSGDKRSEIDIARLSRREKEIADLMLKGKVAREIGEILFISQRTVETHIENLKLKMNCQKKSALIGCLYKIIN